MTYITITGIDYHFGKEAFKVGQRVYLEKDENNEYDNEAILVLSESDMKLGHVANSVRTVAKGTHSAGWVSHLVDEGTVAEVMFIVDHSVIARIISEERDA